MLRTLFIIALSIATLLTAAAWYCQLVGPTGTAFQVTGSTRVAYAVTNSVASIHVLTQTSESQLQVGATASSRSVGFGGLQLWYVKSRAFHGTGDTYAVRLHFPIWLPTVLVVGSWIALPFVSRRLKRRRRRKRGLCVKCGYDLTGNESGVCPECGNRT